MNQSLILKGQTILVTRPKHQAADLSSLLTELGASVIELPLIQIVEPAAFAELDKAITEVSRFDWIIFTSKNSVRSFLQRASSISKDISKMLQTKPTKLAAIGINTANLLKEHGLKISYVPEKFEQETFLNNFPGYPDLQQQEILWPRTDIGDDYILQKFTAYGARITLVEAYQSKLPADVDNIIAQLSYLLGNKKIDIITLTSAQIVQNFVDILNSIAGRQKVTNEGFSNLLEDVTLVSIGPQTTARASFLSLPTCLEAAPHDLQGLVQTIVTHVAGTDLSRIRLQA